MIIQIAIQLIFFTFASFISFYLPGLLVVSSFNLKSKTVNILLSYVFGIVMWVTQGYIFGYLNIRWFTYLYLGFISIFSIIKYKNSLLTSIGGISFKFIFKNKITAILILLGVIAQLIPIVGSGLIAENGVTFFGNSAFDGLTHLGFIQSLVDYFPPVEPGVYDLPLRNYHYLADLVIAEFSRIWKIPISLLLFQFFPLLISLFTGIGAYLTVRVFGGSKKMANWMMFLLYFAGDGAYIIILMLHGILSFNTPAIDNGVTQFLNMPNVLAKMIFITALIPLQYFISSNKKALGLLSVLFLAPLVGFKIYFGIFSILGFTLLIFGKFIRSFFESTKFNIFLKILETIRKEWFNLSLLFIFAIIVLAIYIPTNAGAGGLFFVPLEWPKSFLGSGSIDWKDWWLRMQVYEEHANYRNIYILDTLAIVITLVSVYGTRLLGFFTNFKLLRFLGWEKILFFLPGLFIFQFLGLFTLQITGGLNVFYFFVVSCAVLSLFSAFILCQLSESKNIFIKIFLIIFILLTIPRAIYEIAYYINNYQTRADSYTILNDEISAMEYINKHTSKNAVVQSSPENSKDYRVGYLSTFSKRLTYLSGTVFLETRNQNIANKKLALKQMFETTNVQDFAKLAKDRKIRYIYLQKNPQQSLKFPLDRSFLKIIYENNSIMVIELI
jgi:hypothetical protein